MDIQSVGMTLNRAIRILEADVGGGSDQITVSFKAPDGSTKSKTLSDMGEIKKYIEAVMRKYGADVQFIWPTHEDVQAMLGFGEAAPNLLDLFKQVGASGSQHKEDPQAVLKQQLTYLYQWHRTGKKPGKAMVALLGKRGYVGVADELDGRPRLTPKGKQAVQSFERAYGSKVPHIY